MMQVVIVDFMSLFCITLDIVLKNNVYVWRWWELVQAEWVYCSDCQSLCGNHCLKLMSHKKLVSIEHW